MKTGIIGILNNPATSLNSHSAGMVHIVSELFDADVLTENDQWQEYGRLIIYHGVNFRPGSFNVIGGINSELLMRVEKFISYTEEVYSLDGFQMSDFLTKRGLDRSYQSYDKTIMEISLPQKSKMVIGDSHSLSVWPDKSYGISRNDGKTLHGFLKMNMDLSKLEHVILYFGNIDLRFHLMRQPNPVESTIELFTRYVNYAKQFNCTLVTLLPIEDESRKIPGTGQYKGKNFFGSKEERKNLRIIANDIIKNSGLPFIEWPDNFLDSNGDLKFEVMEPRQSVHIRPKYYIRNINQQTKSEWKLL